MREHLTFPRSLVRTFTSSMSGLNRLYPVATLTLPDFCRERILARA
jgi:hypothetical protein